MSTRIAFDDEFSQALRVRGLTLSELARRAAVTVATASAAVRGRPLNVTTATRLARALAAAPVIPELEAWARPPGDRGEVPSVADGKPEPMTTLMGRSRDQLAPPVEGAAPKPCDDPKMQPTETHDGLQRRLLRGHRQPESSGAAQTRLELI
jgi:transcriptional regulator with XRE-family HTH domain